MRNTFKVFERLKKEQQIDTLFREGKAFSVFPLRLIYIITARTDDQKSPVLVGFSVPKKKFKHSVDRHRIRRLMFESWRLQKQDFYEVIPENCQVHLFIIFTDTQLPEYTKVFAALTQGVQKLKTLKFNLP